MKKRFGFVSNSSTSSFFCFGIQLKEKEIKEFVGTEPEKETEKSPACLHQFDRERMKFCPECGKEAWEEHEYEPDPPERFYDLEEIPFFKQNKLDCIPWEDTCYIGIDLENTKLKGEKAAQEIARVTKVLKEKFGRYPEFLSGIQEGG